MTPAALDLLLDCLAVITGATGLGLGLGVVVGMIRDGLERS